MKRLIVLTGAGISAESGIPTFRSAQGLWTRFRPEDFAHPEAFARRAEEIWAWYRERRRNARKAQPNAAHRALVKAERHLSEFLLVTQNVDNLHRRAGTRHLVELHGNLFRERCTRCAFRRWAAEASDFEEGVPMCPRCGAPLRPDVVWFGEPLPPEAWEQAVTFVVTADPDQTEFWVVGTSAQVYPAADLPRLAARRGIPVVVVNLEPTPLDALADRVYHEKAGDRVPELVKEVVSRSEQE